ncbi:4-hydroxythreonine-4-phosphate dehydrogenase PdxA [Blastococcus brunescens]|uniref:4-hydroxythreonine-4-phosphate dehydrogenase PdxA n=1 Tax=Blastococcus brunescens TaxID=1564165 RepID=A0ABZ1B397_9ACTN|nr:4-hydroxythreonine-4-phosphate dehydrogenase PdxA [Blastococcus sp. BMG 8361]WRL65287.1 4-hydroxythreonine-4-phosphate dehydrogenase PdxA [Blastococcus sp. BMG 8361]
MAEVLVVADDLTGANATAAGFAGAGLRAATASVASGAEAITGMLSRFDVVVATTDSRHVAPDVAAGMVRSTVRAGWPARLVCNRIDTTLRGNIGATTEAVVAEVGALTGTRVVALCAPAHPAAGRHTIGGTQLLDGRRLEETEVARDARTPMRTSDVAEILRQQTDLPTQVLPMASVTGRREDLVADIRSALDTGVAVLVADATTDEHLQRIADAAVAASEGMELVWVTSDPGPGSVAMARALGLHPAARGAPLLVVSGSATELTRKQLQQLAAERAATVHRVPCLPGSAVPDPEAATAVLVDALSSAGPADIVVFATVIEDSDVRPTSAEDADRIPGNSRAPCDGRWRGTPWTGCSPREATSLRPSCPSSSRTGWRSPGRWCRWPWRAPSSAGRGTACTSPPREAWSGTSRRPWPAWTTCAGPWSWSAAMLPPPGPGHPPDRSTGIEGDAHDQARTRTDPGRPRGDRPGDHGTDAGRAGRRGRPPRRRRRGSGGAAARRRGHGPGRGGAHRRRLRRGACRRGHRHRRHRSARGRRPRVGKVDERAGRAAVAAIETATRAAMDQKVAGIVTGPINKEAIWAAGSKHLGHTEMLGELTGVTEQDTMFVVRNSAAEGHHLRIFFTTRHVSLRKAIDQLTKERIQDSIRKAHTALQVFGVQNPRLAVAALNPHGGENGNFGDEEIVHIAPACEAAREEGLDVSGPIPADSVFHQGLVGRYDGVLSQYHDQGHIPAKTFDFDGTISVTVGLPILRTSVDHGTAFDIAGTGKAGHGTMLSAYLAAVDYAPFVDNIRRTYGS